MTMISAWMRLEELDRSEPASFYVPGATVWWKREVTMNGAPIGYEEWEVQEFVTRWVEDEM